MQKWGYFTLGILSGVLAVLVLVLVQRHEPVAYAQAATVSSGETVMGVGGATSQQSDIVWILKKVPVPEGLEPKLEPGQKSLRMTPGERLVLACYQVSNGARNTKLVSVRDITFDLYLLEYQNDKPHVKDIMEEIRKAMPRDEKSGR